MILSEQKQNVRGIYWGRILATIVGIIYFYNYATNPSEWHYIDGTNILIHEAGHVIFFLFGNFMTLAGGSIMQILIPSLFIYYFYNHGQFFSSSFLLFWLGQNLINISIYSGDAMSMQLPLLGGDGTIHDWNEMLQQLGLLSHTALISQSIYILGLILFATATILCLKFSFNREGYFFRQNELHV
ncbi:MAG: hypothetical protein WCK11_02125 [Candidatus Falkowbacteria bacterium]